MVADSITDSDLFHGSPISRDFLKKRKATWLWKLKQWKIDARRKQWIHLWKRANVGEERLKSLSDERKSCSERFSYIEEWRRIDDDDDDNETDLGRASSGSSPTSVLKSKDSSSSIKSGEDCFCCSKQVNEEEDEDFDDALENFDSLRDALPSFSENKGTTTNNPFHEETRELEQEVLKPSPSQRRKKKSSGTNNLIQKEKCESSEKAVHQMNRRNKNKSGQQQESEKQNQQKCPVCTEEMDETDLKFSPCPCGFLVCLFCHKQINENDEKCPSCRKKYDQSSTNSGEIIFQQPGSVTLRLSPSFKGLDRA